MKITKFNVWWSDSEYFKFILFKIIYLIAQWKIIKWNAKITHSTLRRVDSFFKFLYTNVYLIYCFIYKTNTKEVQWTFLQGRKHTPFIKARHKTKDAIDKNTTRVWGSYYSVLEYNEFLRQAYANAKNDITTSTEMRQIKISKNTQLCLAQNSHIINMAQGWASHIDRQYANKHNSTIQREGISVQIYILYICVRKTWPRIRWADNVLQIDQVFFSYLNDKLFNLTHKWINWQRR